MPASTETVPTMEAPAFEPHPITLDVYRSMADLGLILPPTGSCCSGASW